MFIFQRMFKCRHVNKDGSLQESRTGGSRNWRFVFTQKALSFVFGFQGVASADAREDEYCDWQCKYWRLSPVTAWNLRLPLTGVFASVLQNTVFVHELSKNLIEIHAWRLELFLIHLNVDRWTEHSSCWVYWTKKKLGFRKAARL